LKKLDCELDDSFEHKPCYFDPKYLIREDGQVYSLYKNKYLVPYKSRTGYWLHYLKYNEETKGFLIHRLVAKHFVPNIYEKPEVNHINCDKSNNHHVNLVWVNKQENTEHAIRHGCYGKRFKNIPDGMAYRKVNGKYELIKLV
jgi:hypothetical protein